MFYFQGFEADVSSPLCTTTSNSTNCTLERSDDASNSSSSVCNAEMKLSENTLTYCQPLSDISNASQTDLEEANSDKLNFTTTPSYEHDTDQQYKADLSDNDISTEEGQSGQLITSNEYNSSQSSLSEHISIDYEIISILENILPALLDGIHEENRVNITHYYNNTDKVNNSSYAEDNPIIKPTEIGEPVIHDFTDSLVGHESNNNTTENPTLSTELTTDNSMNESSFWYKLFHWPSLKTKKDLEKIKRKKREDNQHRVDSEECQDLENEGAAGDTVDLSTSEEMVKQHSNSTENCDSGECISIKEVVDDSAVPSNYDIKITEIRNEIVILQNEILESDPGETTTAAVWNTNSFIDRLMRSLVPKYIDKRNVNTVQNDSQTENVTSTTENAQPSFINDEDLFLLETSLLDVFGEDINIIFQTNTRAQPDVITVALVNSTLEEPANILGTNNTATEENMSENTYTFQYTP